MGDERWRERSAHVFRVVLVARAHHVRHGALLGRQRRHDRARAGPVKIERGERIGDQEAGTRGLLRAQLGVQRFDDCADARRRPSDRLVAVAIGAAAQRCKLCERPVRPDALLEHEQAPIPDQPVLAHELSAEAEHAYARVHLFRNEARRWREPFGEE